MKQQKESNLTIHEMLTKITYEPMAKVKAQKRLMYSWPDNPDLCFEKELYSPPAYNFDAQHQGKCDDKNP